jgi:glyoxylase-like metal-dependent hydrolase (beta-lactamase superfamily II)
MRDGALVRVGSADLVAVHTPGHTPDHLCFVLGDRLFTGDHIMGGSTVIIEDAAAYMESLYKVRELAVSRIEPGHGSPMDEAGRVIDDYIEHRKMRERQLLAAIDGGARTVTDLVAVVYGDVPSEIVPAAAHQVRVQLDKLSGEGLVLLVPGGTGRETRVELTR